MSEHRERPWGNWFMSPLWCAAAALLALLPTIFLGRFLAVVCVMLALTMLLMTVTVTRRQREDVQWMMQQLRDQQHQVALSEEKYRLLAENANVVVMSYDLRSKRVDVAENYFKYFPDGLLYDSPQTFPYLHPSDRARLAQRYQDDPNRKSWDVELRLKTRTGDYCWFRVIARTLCDDNDEPERLICRMDNIDDQKRRLEILNLRAQTDGATGLYTKAATEKLIKQALVQMKDGLTAMLLIDLDNLKRINDNLGHMEGDRAILAVARTLKTRFRDTDIIGRVGGDEFMIFLTGLKGEDWVCGLAGIILDKIHSICIGPNNDYPLSVSIGISFATGESVCFEKLYQEADEALYHVKRGGKNGTAVYGRLKKAEEA